MNIEQIASYNILVLLLLLFVILVVVLIVTNKSGFNSAFVTAPILIIFLFLIKQSYVSKSSIYILLTVLVGIAGIISMAYLSSNSSSTILNFVLIIGLAILSFFIYANSKTKDNNPLIPLSPYVQDMYNLRTKYTIILFLLVLSVIILYFVNPWNIMSTYSSPVIFFSLFTGIVIAIMIVFYQSKLADPITTTTNISTSSILLKGVYILASLGISFGLIYGLIRLMNINNFSSDISHNILNIILFATMLGIIYKLANAGGFLEKNPYYRLILNTLLYIPCLLVILLHKIYKLFGLINSNADGINTKTNPFEIKMLIVSLILLILYFFTTSVGYPYIKGRYLKQGGKQIINAPIPTNTQSDIASYATLSGSDDLSYKYAMSFWYYLDAFPPSNMKPVSILSYAGTPQIKYCFETNTMSITVAKDKSTNSIFYETDADGDRIVYKEKNIKLQKWNHVLINYSGGTMDIFYNGQLVSSAIEVVPYIKLDMLTVGSNNGMSGSVANLMYFTEPVDITTIHTLYTSLKNKNPPTI